MPAFWENIAKKNVFAICKFTAIYRSVGTDCQVALVLTTCFHKLVGLVLRGALVACNSLKTMTTDKLYRRIDYYCMLIYTQSLIWPATRSHYSLNFGSEKIGSRTIKLAYIYVCIF